MEYQIALKKTEEGYTVWVPELRGCISEGLTREEALENIQDAIAEYLADVRESLAAESDIEIQTVVLDRKVA